MHSGKGEEIELDFIRLMSRRQEYGGYDTYHLSPHGNHMGEIVGHPLVGFFANMPFSKRIGQTGFKNHVAKVGFFLPTSGFGDFDDRGAFSTNWKLRDVQVDFLLEFYDHWDEMGQPALLLDFFDESPELRDILIQICHILQMYEIPRHKFFIQGHNLNGQNYCDSITEELGEESIHYIPSWDMIGHMDTKSFSNFHAGEEGASGQLNFKDVNDWDTIRTGTITFLNRRPDMARTMLAWKLYKNDYWQYQTVTSFYPPLEYFNVGTAPNNHNPDFWMTGRYLENEFSRHGCQAWIDDEGGSISDELAADFREKMRAGKSLEDDHDFIGGMESQYIPFKDSTYIWLTCESNALYSDSAERANLFITEKSLKPLYLGLATIIFSWQGFLAKFKRLGFHTLAEEFGIDESYDDIASSQHRAEAIAKEVQRLQKKTPEQLHKCRIAAKPKILENQQRLAAMLTNWGNNYYINLNAWLVHTIDDLIDDPDAKITGDVYEIFKGFYRLDDN
jgi:hypothetical protein